MVEFCQRYCGMEVVHERSFGDGSGRAVVWVAEPARREALIFVLLPDGSAQPDEEADYSHLGFAMNSRAEVDEVARRAESEGRLIWPPRDEPYPVGYYCGVRAPAGHKVEFSYGQPLGPGAGSGGASARAMSSSTRSSSAKPRSDKGPT